MPFATGETAIWDKPIPPETTAATDEQLNARYEAGGRKLILESNREKLQNFYQALLRPGYMNLRPFYQRRPRWDNEHQSQFIESFILNLPVPMLYLYEVKPNVYEVIDGQQRITAIMAFFSDQLVLEGLTQWPELNGRKYSTLPKLVRDGIERRSISYYTVVQESAGSEEEALFLKQTLFERLNTGGVDLSSQEIRNSLYSGPFNELLLSLSQEALFRQLWTPSLVAGTEPLKSEKDFYAKMEDAELVLRFFALRHVERFRGGMKRFLDLYMERARHLSQATVDELGGLYRSTLTLAHQIYGDNLFREYLPTEDKWQPRRLKAVADGELIALSERLESTQTLLSRREQVVEATKDLFRVSARDDIIGRDSKVGIESRINLFRSAYDKVCGA